MDGLFYKVKGKGFNTLLNAVSNLHRGLSAYKPYVELLQSLSGALPLRYIMPHVSHFLILLNLFLKGLSGCKEKLFSRFLFGQDLAMMYS